MFSKIKKEQIVKNAWCSRNTITIWWKAATSSAYLYLFHFTDFNQSRYDDDGVAIWNCDELEIEIVTRIWKQICLRKTSLSLWQHTCCLPLYQVFNPVCVLGWKRLYLRSYPVGQPINYAMEFCFLQSRFLRGRRNVEFTNMKAFNLHAFLKK